MFDRPGLIMLVSLATLGPLVGLAFVRWMNNWQQPRGIDAVFSFFTLAAIDLFNGLVISTFLAWMYDEYKRLISGDEPKLEKIAVKEKPRMFIDGKPLYATQTLQVKINVEMLFARALIAQSRGSFDVDLTEEYWLKSGRWVNLGGVGALDFREMLHRWTLAAVIGRKNPNAKNSRYIVMNREKIARVASGERV